MVMSTPANIQDVGPDELVGYTKESSSSEEQNQIKPSTKIDLTQIPQGPGSNLDADKVDGFNAVSAQSAGPNVLVATGQSGQLPLSADTNSYYAWGTYGGL